MRVELTPSYILHQRVYRESSLIIDILSATHGRLSLVAKGASSSRSQRRRILQPFNALLIAWSGRGELQQLTDVEMLGHSPNLQGKALFCGFYLNELLLRLLHKHDACPEIFQLYTLAIRDLAEMENLESILRFFEKNLINALGYGINLMQDHESGEDILPDQRYIYEADAGPTCLREGRQTKNGIVISGQSLLALASEQPLLDPRTRQEAKHLMRYLLAPLLGDKPLQSRKFFETVIDR